MTTLQQPPAPNPDPDRYVRDALDWLAQLDPDDDAVPYPLLLTAQRLALIALDRQARIIDLSNRVALLEQHPTVRYLRTAQHPASG